MQELPRTALSIRLTGLKPRGPPRPIILIKQKYIRIYSYVLLFEVRSLGALPWVNTALVLPQTVVFVSVHVAGHFAEAFENLLM